MSVERDATSITRIAGLIGEAGRIQMLTALLDGNSHSASELAMAASVSPQTASSHLSKLLSGGLVVSERSGRRRLFRLKSVEVATAIEALGAIAQVPKLRAIPEVRFARTCYDHLAGALAIAVRTELLQRGALEDRDHEFDVTRPGMRFLLTLGIDTQELRELRRSFAYKCLDWTERHHHIGGALGAALLSRFLELKWMASVSGSRAIRVTHRGEREFESIFHFQCSELRMIPRPTSEDLTEQPWTRIRAGRAKCLQPAKRPGIDTRSA